MKNQIVLKMVRKLKNQQEQIHNFYQWKIWSIKLSFAAKIDAFSKKKLKKITWQWQDSNLGLPGHSGSGSTNRARAIAQLTRTQASSCLEIATCQSSIKARNSHSPVQKDLCWQFFDESVEEYGSKILFFFLRRRRKPSVNFCNLVL